MSRKSFMSWSGGKDSALCLHRVMASNEYSVDCLLTNLNSVHNRVSMHGIRRDLLVQQAGLTGIKLDTVELPESPAMDEYEWLMSDKTASLKQENYTTGIFGDIFLEDLRNYREQQLLAAGMESVFPLWKASTHELMHEFLSLGFKAIVVCVNGRYLGKQFCGKIIDEEFIRRLPPNVDICGENGEYHSFVFDGPIFSEPVKFEIGEIVHRNYPAPSVNKTDCYKIPSPSQYDFYFCDLISLESVNDSQ